MKVHWQTYARSNGGTELTRIGDGGAHLHVWFFARPEGQAQLFP